MEDMFRPEAPPLERILAYLDFVTQRQIKAYEKNGQILGCPLFTLSSEICTQERRLQPLIAGILGTLVAYFEEAIRQAQASGAIEGKNAELKARLFWSFYEGTLTRARIENNPDLVRGLRMDAMALLGVQPCALAVEAA
jgi:TetR/AcrR family transcriptional repressor of nem operon